MTTMSVEFKPISKKWDEKRGETLPATRSPAGELDPRAQDAKADDVPLLDRVADWISGGGPPPDTGLTRVLNGHRGEAFNDPRQAPKRVEAPWTPPENILKHLQHPKRFETLAAAPTPPSSTFVNRPRPRTPKEHDGARGNLCETPLGSLRGSNSTT